MRATRGIRAVSWTLVALGIAAPAARRRVKLPAAAVLGSAALAPVTVCVLVPRSRGRDVAVVLLNMWAYIAAYELPHDDPERQASRVRTGYPIAVDRALGLGELPTVRLQRAFSRTGRITRLEATLAWCHWLWFAAPHATVAYVLWRDPERFAQAAARMYAVFDLGAVFYWTIPTAPPWWAAAHGRVRGGSRLVVRRMMIEYGQQFWRDLWSALFKLLGGNPLAAMPSLHFATSVMGAHLLSEVGPVAGAVGWTYAAMLGVALVYLGEHYVVDLVAEAALTEAVRDAAPRSGGLVAGVSRVLRGVQGRIALA